MTFIHNEQEAKCRKGDTPARPILGRGGHNAREAHTALRDGRLEEDLQQYPSQEREAVQGALEQLPVPEAQQEPVD